MINERSVKPDRYPTTLFSLFRTVTTRSKSLENVSDRRRDKRGHEYPYAIKMKHIKPTTNLSVDGDEQPANIYSHHHNSTASLNNISINSHDFELKKRDLFNFDHQSKKLRFFHKRKTKDLLIKLPIQPSSFNDESYSSTTTTPVRTKYSYQFFGQTLDELMKKYGQQLPPVIQQLLEILYFKGPETTGIFRKVANTRSVKESIDKIERNILLQEDDLHPILAAGIFKHFLRTLPQPMFNSIQYDHWKKCLRLPSLTEKVSFARKNILATLAQSNHLLLKGFICVLHRISQNADTNGMNPFNLGLCVSNSLFKTESTSISSGKQEADVMSSIVEFLILNCSSLFGSDVITCIPDKHILVHQIPNRLRPTASSIESLDEVESSPHLPVVNRSRDSGLATSDQPFNDDSSEVSEHFRRQTPVTPPTPPEWTTSISYGKGTVLTSIIMPTAVSNALAGGRCRNSKNIYKPSRQFMQREKVTNDTTDDSDNDAAAGDSSVRSSSTTVNNMTISKVKRTKPISRHSSLGSSEYQQQQQQQQYFTAESKRMTSTDVKRASSLKQFHHSSDEGDAGDEPTKTFNMMAINNNNNNNNTKKKGLSIGTKKTEQIVSPTVIINSNNSLNERRSRLVKSKTSGPTKLTDDESLTTRSTHFEQQDLDLLSEPLSTINQRLSNSTHSISSSTRSTSFTAPPQTKKLGSPSFITPQNQSSFSTDFHPRYQPSITDGRSRHNGPLAATTNQIYLPSRNEHLSQNNTSSSLPYDHNRTFIHHADARSFQLGTAIQMKPMDDLIFSHGRRRPCHRQNALRYKSIDQDQPERPSRLSSSPMVVDGGRSELSEYSATNISRYPSIERRLTASPQSRKATSFDIHDELRPGDISWSVREKAKLFEHQTKTTEQRKFSTGRENYV